MLVAPWGWVGTVRLLPAMPEAEKKRKRKEKKRRSHLLTCRCPSLQSPTTPFNSVEDFSKQAAQAKARKKSGDDLFNAEALNSKLAELGGKDDQGSNAN